MKLEDYLRQESGIRKGVHLHDGVWWKRSLPGCSQPLYPLQEVMPGSARPRFSKSFIQYSHVVPGIGASNRQRTRTRLLLQGENLKGYSLESLDRKRRQAVNKAVRCGFRTELIQDLQKHRADLHEIYISNAIRNKHGLPHQWYIENEGQWWADLVRENALAGRDWFGVFQGEKLVAFLYACLVDDTAVWFVTKSNMEFLSSDPNDLLWFDVITHYKNVAACRRLDAGWAIPVPPTIDWRKRRLGFEPVELPVFEKMNPLVLGLMRAFLFLANPILRLSSSDSNRGFPFMVRTIQKRLDDSRESG